MKKELIAITSIAEAIARLLHPFAEVVIHDLEENRIERIYNPLSGREPGYESYLERLDFADGDGESIIGPYEKINFDGRKLKSISIVIRDHRQKAIGFLCINIDISQFDNYRHILDAFLQNDGYNLSKMDEALFKNDLYEQINKFVHEYCLEHCLSLENLSREDKQQLVMQLKNKGAFDGKNAANYIARILKVSRATIYNYVKTNGHP
jgi:predicted transcriptional regulator YheO